MFGLIAALAVVALMLGGCGGSDTSETGQDSPNEYVYDEEFYAAFLVDTPNPPGTFDGWNDISRDLVCDSAARPGLGYQYYAWMVVDEEREGSWLSPEAERWGADLEHYCVSVGFAPSP